LGVARDGGAGGMVGPGCGGAVVAGAGDRGAVVGVAG